MIPVPGPIAPPQWYGPPLAVPQTSRLHAVCRLSPQLRAICCVWVMSSLVCGLFASIWDLRFLICRLLEASMHFCLYYVLIPRHVYCHIHGFLPTYYLVYSANNTHIHRGRGANHTLRTGLTSTGGIHIHRGEGQPYNTCSTHIHRGEGKTMTIYMNDTVYPYVVTM